MSLPPDFAGSDEPAGLLAALDRIQASTPSSERYRFEGEVAHGGMGIIERVWDESLRRAVARKVLGKGPSGSDSRQSDPRSIGRFLEEAQVTAQLEHPGVVPVHELGLDGSGKLYFTMRLVKGEDLHHVFEHVRTGRNGWTVTRALHALSRVCEAMSYAHEKGVLHRDLKPANVMVGRFGEVYVMDWGLARVLGAPETKDVRLAPPHTTQVHTDRDDIQEGTPQSPLVTMDGDVVGTPAYMSPEQARGALEEIGPASDVYALGAMLYHLLAGHVPYVLPDVKASPHAIWRWVIEGAPTPLAQRSPGTPAELVAITEKAMARTRAERYASMEDLGRDLRAYLELRVVRAHRTGAVMELMKWTQRNRLAAASLGALLVVLIGAGFSLARMEERRRSILEVALERASAPERLDRFDALGELHPRMIPALEAWMADASTALEQTPSARWRLEEFESTHADTERVPVRDPRADDIEARISSLRVRIDGFRRFLEFHDTEDPGVLEPEWRSDLENELAFRERNRAILAGELPLLQAESQADEAQLRRLPTWRYSDPALSALHEDLRRHLSSLEALNDGPRGYLSLARQRLAAVHDLALRRGADEATWAAARAAIRGSAMYGGLQLEAQAGLVPLGVDHLSGLWEFWHVLSGERPVRAQDGTWDIRPETGIVLILVPGGRVVLGSQRDDPLDENYFTPEPSDEDAAYVTPWIWRKEVELAPFFLARHELTQGQWQRMAGTTPARHWAGQAIRGHLRIDRTHPVESVSWSEAQRILLLHGLCLPTEAQYERAERTGTHTKYGTGSTLDSVLPLARCATQIANSPWDHHAPVDALPPNRWGFQGLYGNVAEWCLDRYSSECEAVTILEDTGEFRPASSATRTYVPGSVDFGPMYLAASARYGLRPEQVQEDLGLRAARAIDP